MRKSKYQVYEGAVYADCNGNSIRRVIAITGDRVFYNKGGDVNYDCLITTFRRWMAVNGAVRLNQRLAA